MVSAILSASLPRRRGIGRCFSTSCDRAESEPTEDFRLLVYLRRLGSPHRVRALGARVEPGGRDSSVDDSCILSCRQMLRRLPTTWKRAATAFPTDEGEPSRERNFDLLRDVKLHGPLCLLLDDGGPDLESNYRTASTLSFTRSQARSLLPMVRLKRASSRIAPLISSRRRIDVLWLQWALLATRFLCSLDVDYPVKRCHAQGSTAPPSASPP